MTYLEWCKEELESSLLLIDDIIEFEKQMKAEMMCDIDDNTIAARLGQIKNFRESLWQSSFIGDCDDFELLDNWHREYARRFNGE